MQIRPARRHEAADLDRIAWAAKAHWGYRTTQLEAWAPSLRTEPATIENWPTWVAELDQRAVAFAQLDPTQAPWELVALWVLPEVMGQGIGKALLATAAGHAAAAGIGQLHIDADPHAAGFYRACGAVQVGTVAAPIDGDETRQRPQLRLPIARA